MTETLIFALLFSKLQLNLRLGKLQIQKESYQIKPIIKRWSIYPVIITSAFYLYLQSLVMRHNYWFLPYQIYIKDAILLSYMILGIDVLLRNEKYKEYIIACCSLLFGFFLNYLAMHFNNGKMPIFPTFSWSTGYTSYDIIMNAFKFGDFHILGDHTTKLIPLCDVFDVFVSIWSVVDAFCRLYAFIIVYYSVKIFNQNFKK